MSDDTSAGNNIINDVHLLSFIFHLSSFIFHLSSFIFHLSSVICHLSSVICHLSSFTFIVEFASFHPSLGRLVPDIDCAHFPSNLRDDVMSGRRTWDKDYYKQKLPGGPRTRRSLVKMRRLRRSGLSDKEEFRSAAGGTPGLWGQIVLSSARSVTITADKEVGQVKVVSAQQMR